MSEKTAVDQKTKEIIKEKKTKKNSFSESKLFILLILIAGDFYICKTWQDEFYES